MKTKSLPLLRVLGVLCGVLFFSACNSPTQNLAAQVAVMLGTERIVKDHPERAAKAVAIATEVEILAGADGAATTVDLVIAAVRARIDLTKLTPTEALAVELLITAVQEELNRKVQAGAIPADLRVKVATVATWIRLAAAPYAATVAGVGAPRS